MFINKKMNTLVITKTAWSKMNTILNTTSKYAFVFSAKGGGCNGFNYDLSTITRLKFDEFHSEHKFINILKNNDTKLLIDPVSEFLLLGTTIDYIKEDYNNNIYESKFVFTPDKKMATTCGCGISFNPKN